MYYKEKWMTNVEIFLRHVKSSASGQWKKKNGQKILVKSIKPEFTTYPSVDEESIFVEKSPVVVVSSS